MSRPLKMTPFEESAARQRDTDWLAMEPMDREGKLWAHGRLADAYFMACYDRRNLILELDALRGADEAEK